MNKRLDEFFAAGIRRQFGPGDVVLRGEEASGIFYIKKGFVKVYSISDEGNKYVHIIYKPGEIFPLIWALKGIRRRVFYEALSDCILYELPKEKFIKGIGTDAKLSNAVLFQAVDQFNVYADRLDNLQHKSAYEKVVYRLLFLAGRLGVKEGSKIVINAPITHEVIAESINLARESASRQIEKLEQLGLVKYRRGQIVIKDAERLSEEFSEPISLDLWGMNS